MASHHPYDLGVPKLSHDEGGLVCLTQRCIPSARLWFWSAVDGGHVPFVVAFANGRSEVVEPFDLFGAQLDAVGGGILLDASDPLGAGDRGDVIALSEQPGQGDLCWCGACLGCNGLNRVDDA